MGNNALVFCAVLYSVQQILKQQIICDNIFPTLRMHESGNQGMEERVVLSL